ncbi:M56 family metallopeptidase [Paludisphaera borealis]|uniref:M56 family metallopeptidase n=1 Tax=Paludisphaera borealis TaxID=1387353 RepID=UPI000970A963|nr:M56 family metallopeptidase [Paludisphaera borealis]
MGVWLLLVWAAAVGLLSFRLFRDARRLSGVIERAEAASDTLAEECAALAARLGCSGPVRVARSAEVLSPCIASAWRPVLLLPARTDLESNREDLQAFLCHELAHVRGRDLMWNYALHATSTLLWFHPLVWKARETHAAACDAVCDAVAVDAMGDVASYGRALARLALRMSGRTAGAYGLAMARASDVRRRITFLNRRVFRHDPPRSLTVPAMLSLCLSAFLIGSLGISRAEPGDEKRQAAAMEEKPTAPQEKREPSQKTGPIRRHAGGYDAQVATIIITGRALDQDGLPAPGADIQVVNDNPMYSGDMLLGKTTSGTDGRFVLRDISLPVLTPPPGAIPKPTEGRFEVSGWVSGKAFAWHATQSYRPGPRPAKTDAKEAGVAFYEGETVTTDLVFGPPARLSGTVTDDAGKPVEGALVQVGYINNVRSPGGSGTWNCSAIAPTGEDVAFRGVASLPESRRSAHTDAHGKYAIEGLPRETKFLALIDHEPTYEPRTLTIATSKESFADIKSLGHDGVLDHVFTVPGTVRVRTTLAGSGGAAGGATVIARGSKIQRSGAIATTDAQGMAVLHLQPDDYTLRAEPPSGVVAVVTELPFKVAKGTKETAVDVQLEAGAPLTFEAVEEATGKGIAGVRFAYETDTTRVRRPVASQTVYVDHPATGTDGRLAVIASPGARRYFADRVPGFEPIDAENPLAMIVAGRPEVVRFRFRPVPAPDARPSRTPNSKDEVVRRLQERWEAQRVLARRGRMRASRVTVHGSALLNQHEPTEGGVSDGTARAARWAWKAEVR